MLKHFLMVVTLSAATGCSSQTIPVAVKDAFAKNFPGTTVKKWEKEHGNYEADFNKDSKTMSATFDAKGNWIETETEIKVSELPISVIGYIKAEYNNATIKEAAAITNPEGKKMYEAEVKGKDLLFDEEGKFLKEGED